MIGCIKAISPCVKSVSAKLFLDLHTMSAPSGEERTLDTSAQVERATRCCRRFDGRTHACCGRAAVMVLVSSASGPRVRGCTRAPRYFGPYPVKSKKHSFYYFICRAELRAQAAVHIYSSISKPSLNTQAQTVVRCVVYYCKARAHDEWFVKVVVR